MSGWVSPLTRTPKCAGTYMPLLATTGCSRKHCASTFSAQQALLALGFVEEKFSEVRL
jgi:hypothetical protein